MLNMIRVRFLEYKPMIPVFISMTVMSLILVYTFGIGFSQEYKPLVAIVNEDNTFESNRIVNELIAMDEFEIIEYEYEDAINLVESSKVIAVIKIPKDYSENVHNGTGVIDFIKTGQVMEHTALELAVKSITERIFGNKDYIDGIEIAYIMSNVNMDREYLENSINDYYNNRPIMIIKSKIYESEAKNTYDSLKQSFMGFTLFFSLFTMVFGIGNIVDNKQKRVWHRQIVSPITGVQILGSALVTGFLIGFLQIGTMMMSGAYIFNIDLGESMISLLLVISAYIISAMCMGLFISGLVKTEQQLSAISPMIIVSTSMLGGCMWPLEIVANSFIRNLSIITPQRWAMEGLRQVIINRGGLSNIVEPITYMLILAIVFFGLSLIPYRKVT